MTLFRLSQLAELTDSMLVGNPDHQISGVEDLASAQSHEAAFLANQRYEHFLKTTQAGVIFVHPSQKLFDGKNYLIHKDPSRAFQRLIEIFNPIAFEESGFIGIHSTAVIHPEATLEASVTIGPCAVIDRKAFIGKGSTIGAGVFIGAHVKMGENCIIHANVIIRENCEIGHRVVIQPGAVIGSCGFGYTTDQKGEHTSLKQVGKVVIEDDVEVGANSCIDRARFKITRIGRGTKIDNLVQIAHGVSIGQHNLIVAQVGIAGSAKTGRNVVLGGQAAVVGHVTLEDQVIIAARGAASKSLPKGIYNGTPAVPIKEYNEQSVLARNLKKYINRIEKLEQTISELKKLVS